MAEDGAERITASAKAALAVALARTTRQSPWAGASLQTPYQQLVLWWDCALEEERASFEVYLTARRSREIAG